MSVLAGLALLSGYDAAPASAAGYLKAAAVGGVAGHLAGHGVLGVVAGCLVGRHQANKKVLEAKRPTNGSGYGNNYNNRVSPNR